MNDWMCGTCKGHELAVVLSMAHKAVKDIARYLDPASNSPPSMLGIFILVT